LPAFVVGCGSARLASLYMFAFGLYASAQGIHEIDDFRWRPLSRCFDLLTNLLFLQQLLQRILD
jgi:hypothetical protein